MNVRHTSKCAFPLARTQRVRLMFDVTPFLHPDDPWARSEPGVARYYPCKYHVAGLLQPKRIVEIGVRAGYSAAAFLSACPSSTYFGFDYNDPGDDSGGWHDAIHLARVMLALHFPQASVIIAEQNTRQLSSLPIRNADLVHVDGDHSTEGCLHDLRLAAQSAAQWILVDDITYLPTVARAVEIFLKESGARSLFFDTPRGDVLIRLPDSPLSDR
jgi:hypothetical protein